MEALVALVWVGALALLWWRAEPLIVRWFDYRDQRRLLDEAANLRADVAQREERDFRKVRLAGQFKIRELHETWSSGYAQDRMAFKREELTSKQHMAQLEADVRTELAAIEAKTHERPPAPPDSEAMPVDLRMYIAEQSDDWAKEQIAQKAGELYAELRNWDLVRSVLTPA